MSPINISFALATIFLVGPFHTTAQPTGTADVFPLKQGTEWKYVFRYSSRCINNFGEGTIYSDSGTVSYRVIAFSTSTDSVLWTIVATSEMKMYRFQKVGFTVLLDTTYISKDTSSSALTEQVTGNHQLNDVSTFFRYFALYPQDSELVFRYQSVDSLGRSALQYVRQLYFHPNYIQLTFARDTGLVKLSAYDNVPCGFGGLDVRLVSGPLTRLLPPRNDHILPDGYVLTQNYPNPFNPTTNFQFSIVNRQLTIIRMYDILGREVATLVNEVKEPGTYTVHWDASRMASGVYLYGLQTAGFTQTRKMVLVR